VQHSHSSITPSCSRGALAGHLCILPDYKYIARLDTVIFFTLRNYEMKDEKYYFIIFTIAIYERNYIIIGQTLAIVQCLLSRTKYIIIFIFVWNERY
jgi:hypothetical protein